MAVKSDFTKNETYAVDSLNNLLGCFVASGCIGTKDLVVRYKDSHAVVGQGKAVLPDRKIITVGTGGHSIPLSGQTGYVYIKDGDITYGAGIPADALPLAYIDGSDVTDLRKRAYIYA